MLKVFFLFLLLVILSRELRAAFLRGIDVSMEQSYVNWTRVRAAGVQFAIARATEGNHFQDFRFVENWNGMKKNNITAAAYHFLRGGQHPSMQKFNIEDMLSKCNFDKDNDILAIYVHEYNNENVMSEQMAKTLHGLLKMLDDFKNIYIACDPFYWDDKIDWRNYDFNNYKLWVLHHTVNEYPMIPDTWEDKGYVWWQYSDMGRVAGVDGPVALDRDEGDDLYRDEL